MTEITWFTQPKIFTIWLFTEKTLLTLGIYNNQKMISKMISLGQMAEVDII